MFPSIKYQIKYVCVSLLSSWYREIDCLWWRGGVSVSLWGSMMVSLTSLISTNSLNTCLINIPISLYDSLAPISVPSHTNFPHITSKNYHKTFHMKNKNENSEQIEQIEKHLLVVNFVFFHNFFILYSETMIFEWKLAVPQKWGLVWADFRRGGKFVGDLFRGGKNLASFNCH